MKHFPALTVSTLMKLVVLFFLFNGTSLYAQQLNLCEKLSRVVHMVSTDSISGKEAERTFFSKEGEEFKPLISVFGNTSEIKLQKRYGIVNFMEESFDSKRYTFAFSYHFLQVLQNIQTCLSDWKLLKNNLPDSEMREAYVFSNSKTDANIVLETSLHSPYRIRLKVFKEIRACPRHFNSVHVPKKLRRGRAATGFASLPPFVHSASLHALGPRTPCSPSASLTLTFRLSPFTFLTSSLLSIK